jgi:arylsulfate sulfotransferase
MRANLFLLLFLVLFTPSCSEENLSITKEVEVPPEKLITSVAYDSLAPLAGMVRLQTERPTLVELQISGAEQIAIFSNEISTRHNIPLTGFYPGQENYVIYKVRDQSLQQFAIDSFPITAPPLPEFMPEIRIDRIDEARMEPGWTLIEFHVGRKTHYEPAPLAFDRKGNIRWYIDLAWTGGLSIPFEPLQNGEFGLGRHNRMFAYDKLGRQSNSWRLTGHNQHHDIHEKPNGNLVVPTLKPGLTTVQDFIAEVDRQSGQIIREWDLRQALDVDRFELIRNPRDWLHVNSVWFDERDSSLIISAKHQGVFKISQNNELHWILAPHRGWGKAGPNGEGPETANFLLTAVDAQGKPYPESIQEGTEGVPDFRWPWGQHAAMLLPDGKLLVFDNGWHRNFRLDGPFFSRAVVYDIDEEERSVRQIWQYGEERGAAIHSPILSDVDYLPKTGNVLLTSGFIQADAQQAKVIEVGYPSREVVFEATILFRNLHGGGGGGWKEVDLVYRGERLRLWNR